MHSQVIATFHCTDSDGDAVSLNIYQDDDGQILGIIRASEFVKLDASDLTRLANVIQHVQVTPTADALEDIREARQLLKS